MEQLSITIQNSDLRAIEILIAEQTINLDDTNDRGQTPLIEAIQVQNIEVVKLLLHHGADVNSSNEYSVTPLIVASGLGYGELVKVLIQHGAHLNLGSETDETALHFACGWGKINTVKILIDHRIDLDHKNIHGNTALHDMIRGADVSGNGTSQEIVQLLLQAGAQNLSNNEGITPRDIAETKNYNHIIELFDNYEIQIKEPDCI
jgi:ankyrin repeat protein